MSSELRSIDDTLVRAMSEQRNENAQSSVQAPVPEVSTPNEPVKEAAEQLPTESIEKKSVPSNDPEADPVESAENDESAESLPVAAKSEAPKEDGEGSPIDEYGNPVAKPKMYSEEEVQRMIRDRLARGRHAETQQSQPPQPAAKQEPQSQSADSGDDSNWEAQLEQFVEKTIEKRQARSAEQQYRQQEAARQAEFEAKFSSGMSRYGDFREVVANKPITDAMMMATRALEDPAAFLYGASRMHPQEVERISRIGDPLAVAAEVGRLHERMIKERKALSNAPRPVETPRGDMPRKDDSRVPIDTLIAQHAKRKFAR